MGHCPRGTATAQLGTRLLQQAPRKKGLCREEGGRECGGGGGGSWNLSPALLGQSGSCALIGRSLQRASRLGPLRPLRFELHFCGFARAARGSVAGVFLCLACIGRFLSPRGCCLADWCILCPPWSFFGFCFLIPAPRRELEERRVKLSCKPCEPLGERCLPKYGNSICPYPQRSC